MRSTSDCNRLSVLVLAMLPQKTRFEDVEVLQLVFYKIPAASAHVSLAVIDSITKASCSHDCESKDTDRSMTARLFALYRPKTL